MRLALAIAVVVVLGGCTGVIDEDGEGGGGGTSGSDGEPPMVEISGPSVLAHVQRYANYVCADTSACTISTYEGHQPTAARAIDTLVSDVYGQVPSDGNALGDRVASYALAHQAEHGITYVIWRQRYNDGAGWKPMEDRGSITQNHYDHVHVSFDETP